jgi:hypothetical protein
LCCLAATVRAEPKGEANDAAVTHTRRVIVEPFHGTEAKAVRSAVVSALEAEVTLDVVSVRLYEKHKKEIDGSPEGYATVSEKLDLLAFFRGKMGGGQGGYILALTVIRGENGKSLGTVAFHGRTIAELKKAIASDLLSEVEPMLARAAGKETADTAVVAPPPPKPEPEPEPEPEPKPEPESKPEPAEKPEPEPEPARTDGTCPFLELDLALGATQRAFNWVDEVRGPLRGFDMNYAPYGTLRAAYRPFAHSRCGFMSGFGVRLGYERAFGITSTLGQQALDTLAFAFEGQVELKIPFSVFFVTPRTGFVYRQFQVAGNYTPDPRYKLWALGLDAGMRLGVFLTELGGSARFVLDAGSLQSADWFPEATGFGWQAEARIGAAPLAWLDAYALVEYESYSFDLNPTATGAYPNGVATGSYDRYLRFGLGARFYFPGRTSAK